MLWRSEGPSRRERREQRRRAAAEAEWAARVARAQKRFAQATDSFAVVPSTPPLPTTTPSREEQEPDLP